MVSMARFFFLALFLFNTTGITGIDSSELLDDPDIRCHLNGDCELPLIPAEPPLIPAISPTEVNIGFSDYQTMVICVCLAATTIVVSLILAFVYYRYSKTGRGCSCRKHREGMEFNTQTHSTTPPLIDL